MSVPLTTILLATDGSTHAELAGAMATHLAARLHATIQIAHIWRVNTQYAYPELAMTGSSFMVANFEQTGRATLAKAALQVEAAGIPVAATHLRMGRPHEEITAIAREIGADLIVMGSRGLGLVKRLLLGSVAEGVVHTASCPVLIVRGSGTTWTPTEIVIGVDGSAGAHEVAAVATSIGGALGIPATLVRAFPPLSEFLPDNIVPQARLLDEAIGRAEQDLQGEAVRLADQCGQQVTVRVVTGDPATSLLHLADEATHGSTRQALIAVGSRGLTVLQRLRLGSVSTTIVHAAAGSVLVVPAHAQHGPVQEQHTHATSASATI